MVHESELSESASKLSAQHHNQAYKQLLGEMIEEEVTRKACGGDGDCIAIADTNDIADNGNDAEVQFQTFASLHAGASIADEERASPESESDTAGGHQKRRMMTTWYLHQSAL